jgi:hypothetical protein
MPRPRLNVPAPLFTPLPFGLLATLATEIRTPTNRHWEAGVQWESLCAEGDTTFDECFAVTGTAESDVAPPEQRAETASYTRRGATPFTVYARLDCSAPGFWDRMDADANTAFTQSEQWQVERAFWTGLAADKVVVFPHLAEDAELVTADGSVTLQTAATVVTGGTGVDIIEGMGRLQAALSDCYDGVGVIHVPRSLEPALSQASLIVREGNRYRTTQGHIVVLGAGYTGSSPSGAALTDSDYIYATGGMFIYRGPLRRTSGEIFERDTNLAVVEVERTYVLGWDCCHLAVNISL